MTLQERIAKQQERAAQIKALAEAAKGGEFTEEQRSAWEAVNTEYDAEQVAIDTEHRKASIDSRLAQIEENAQRRYGLPGNTTPPNGAQDRNTGEPSQDTINRAIRGWAAGRSARPEDIEAARSLGIDLTASSLTLSLAGEQPRSNADFKSYRAMNPLQGSAGGFLVAPAFTANLEMAQLQYDTLRNVSEVIRTETGAPMTWPTSNDTSNEGEWLAVGSEISNQDLSIAAKIWYAHTISSKSVKVDRTLLQDAAFDMGGVVARALGERIGRGQGRAHTTGNGVGQPTGIVTAATLGKTAASQTAVTFDEIMDLVSGVDSAYAVNSAFMMNRVIKFAVRKLKDGQGRYLWEPSTAAGEPDSILGYRVYENSFMDSAMTSGKKIMLFGDLSK